MMDGESETETSIIDETAARRERIVNRIWFGYYALSFIATFSVNIYTIIIAVPILKTCYNVALVVLIIGTVLGFIQLVPEFFRNFIKLQPTPGRYVNYFFLFIVAVRIVWLIASTVMVVKSQCDGIGYAWVSIYVNWGILGSTVVIVCIIVIVRKLKARHQTRL